MSEESGEGRIDGIPYEAEELYAIRNYFFRGHLRYSPAFWLNPSISRDDVIRLFHAFWHLCADIPAFHRLTQPWRGAFHTGVWTWNCHRALINALGYVILFDKWYHMDYMLENHASLLLQNFS
jgi:hypothetical protein